MRILTVCICNLRYSARNTHAPYCHPWPAPLYNISPHYLINGTIFERRKKKLPSTKYVFLFSLQLFSETFLILRRYEPDMIKNVYWYSCPILMKLEFSLMILEKYWNIKYHENPSSGSRGVPCGRTVRRADITKLIAAFRNFANAPKKVQLISAWKI